VRFDHRFGLGSVYPTGEEIIFLVDAFRAGLDIRYAPIPIVEHPLESSGSNLAHNFKLIHAKGALFARVTGVNAYLYSFLFALRHYHKSHMSFFKFVRVIFGGVNDFLLLTRQVSPQT